MLGLALGLELGLVLGLYLGFVIFRSKKSADPHVRMSAFYPWPFILRYNSTVNAFHCFCSQCTSCPINGLTFPVTLQLLIRFICLRNTRAGSCEGEIHRHSTRQGNDRRNSPLKTTEINYSDAGDAVMG